MTSKTASSSNGVNLTSGSNTDLEQREVEITEEHEVCPMFYRAAASGAIKKFDEVQPDVLPRILTPNNNTILHINIASQATRINIRGARCRNVSTKFMEQLLQKCPTLLLKANHKGETPLHTAARCQLPAVVEVLIKRAETQHEDPESGLEAVRQMLRMVDRMNNTALHVAVMSGSTGVVKLLTEKDPDFPYSANDSGQTPLFIAALVGDPVMVAEILKNCKVLAHEGPNGQTALHAAAVKRPEITKAILKKIPNLSRETDENGWTPLHYAAYNGVVVTAKVLLEFDTYPAYIKDKHKEMTPLLLAAGQGHAEVVLEIVRNCPACIEIVNKKGWNVLHFAMVSFPLYQLQKIMITCLPVAADLINNKEVKGNTPLHVMAFSKSLTFEVIGMYEIWKLPEKYSVLDERNMSALDVQKYGSLTLKEEIENLYKKDEDGPYRQGVIRRYNIDSESIETLKKINESHLVVAALIATVTFAAGFTVPGGYKEEDSKNPGSAILSKNAAFQAFLITNAIAMIFSLSAVFIHYLLPVLNSLQSNMFDFLYKYEMGFTLVSMGAMVIAFITGTYAVVVSSSLWLAIFVCVIGLSFFIVYGFVYVTATTKILGYSSRDFFKPN